MLPTAPGYTDNYYARDNFESTLHKIDTKVTWTPGNRLNLNNRVSWLTSRQNSHGIFPSLDGAEFNPLSVGRLWQANITSGSVLATSILSQSFVVDGVFGYTPYHSWVGPEGPEDECWGDHFAIPNACQPPRSRDRATPMFNMGRWALVTPSQMRDYADNQMQFSANAGWTKGTHNVKFGFDVQHNYLNHYETAVPVFTFNGGATALSGGTAPNTFNQFADFLLGTAAIAKRAGDDAAARHRRRKGRGVAGDGAGLGVGAVPARPMADHAQDDRVGWRPVGVLPVPDAHRSRARDVRFQHEPAAGVRHRRRESTGVRHQSPEGSLHAAARSGIPANRRHRHSRRLLPQPAERQRDYPCGRHRAGVSADHSDHRVGAEYLHTGRLGERPACRSCRRSICRPASSACRRVRASRRSKENSIRGTITSWNVTAQKLFPHSLSVTVGYVANRQNDQTRQVNLNYGQIGGGAASQPFNQPNLTNGLRTTAAMNVFRPWGKITYDSFQLSVTRRMIAGFQFTSAYTYARAIDWWAGNIAIPEYYDLNKAMQGGGSFQAARARHEHAAQG